ncbi:MAG: glycosyltransferase [Geobacteraceae bacterium]|nr:glycosyltransferase [Geobacteraceae bacterium]
MKILIVAPFVPWPLAHGGRIRLYHLLRGLAESNEVTLVCLSEEQNPDVGDLYDFCRQVVTVFHKPAFISCFWRFLTGSVPYNAVRFHSHKLYEKLTELIRIRDFDLVHLETTHIWSAAAFCGDLPVVLGTQNIESKILRQLEQRCTNSLKRLLYRLEIRKMQQFEESAWRSCRLCLAVSNDERLEMIASGAPADRVITVPNGVDLQRFVLTPRPGGKRLLFLCGLDYHPNMDAARWLLNDIWPLIRRSVPDASLMLAGRKTDQLPLPVDAGVSGLGDPSDVPACFATADALLVPLRIGAGTRLKILEAMAAGLPVISTSCGCEGTLARTGEHLLQAETPAAFAAACKVLLSDPAISTNISAAARKLVEENYSWRAIGLGLSNHFVNINWEKDKHGIGL